MGFGEGLAQSRGETARVNLSHYHILALGPRISTDLSGMTECNKAVVCPIINRDIRDRKGDSAENSQQQRLAYSGMLIAFWLFLSPL
jgi:hypothetical protein